MLNKSYALIVAVFLSDYIKAGEYSIIPAQVQVVSRCSFLEKKYPFLARYRNELFSLDPSLIIVLLNWLKTENSNDNFGRGNRFAFETLVKIFTFVNENNFTFTGCLNQESINLIKDRYIKFSDFTVKRNKENPFKLDVCLTQPINTENIKNKIDNIMLAFQQNEFFSPNFFSPNIEPWGYDKKNIIKNKSGDIVQFFITLQGWDEFLTHSKAKMSLVPKELHYYGSSGFSSKYPKKFAGLSSSDIIRSFYAIDNFFIVELMDEHIRCGDYEAEYHDEAFGPATNHRILMIDVASKKLIQTLQLPVFNENNCPYKNITMPFSRARFDIIDIIDKTLLMHDGLTKQILCFSLAKNNFITFTEGDAGISGTFIERPDPYPLKVTPVLVHNQQSDEGWQVTAKGDRACTIC